MVKVCECFGEGPKKWLEPSPVEMVLKAVGDRNGGEGVGKII